VGALLAVSIPGILGGLIGAALVRRWWLRITIFVLVTSVWTSLALWYAYEHA
jgi:hypothetical protein